MERGDRGRGPMWTVVAAAALLSLALPGAAAAVVPGPNGKILFTSGRPPAASDSFSQIWFVSKPGATPVQETQNTSVQYRHASWSPDRTRIAVARGTGPSGPWDIWVHDVRT